MWVPGIELRSWFKDKYFVPPWSFFFEEVVQQVFNKAQPYGGLPDARPAETKGEVTVGIYYTCIVTRYLHPSPHPPLQLEKWAQRRLPMTIWFLMGS